MHSRRPLRACVIAVAVLSALPALSCASEDDQTGATSAATLSDCGLETVILHLIGDRSAIDCGRLPVGSDSGAVLAANGCASEAHAARRPFRLTVEEQGIDSLISTSYIGTDVGGQYVVLRVVYDSMGVWPNGANVQWWPCAPFTVASDCDLSHPEPYSATDPCISCTLEPPDVCECAPSTYSISCGPLPEA